jgi:cellulose biosynthesis protein BcsQ
MDSTGQILTFYSYKGGVGRSMGLANVAALLSKWRRKVLIVDWDLEAPGIESYVESYVSVSKIRKEKPGVIDLVHSLAGVEKIDWHDCLISVPLNDRKTFEVAEELKIISAGRDAGQYVSHVQNTNWAEMFRSDDLGIQLETLRNEWKNEFDFILIDSRTGITDIGGVCTIHLPDILVVWFTTNESSVLGVKHVADQARIAQNDLPFDRNPLLVLPVPSRDDSRSEVEKATDWYERFDQVFGGFYSEWLPSGIKPADAIARLRIPYIPYWSFGENLPVVEEDPSGLSQAYDALARLIFFNLNWQRIDSNPEQSIEYLRRAAEVDLNRFGPELADTVFDQALALWKEELKDQSTEAARTATEIWEKLAPTNLRLYGLKLARAKRFLSELLEDSNEQEAITQARDAIDGYLNLYQTDETKYREEVATGLIELSDRLHGKEPDIAIDALSRAIDILRRLAQSNPRFDVELARTLYDLANWYIEEKQFTAALAAVQEAVSIYKRLIKTDKERFDPDLADSLITLSECLLETGSLPEALENGYESVEIYKQLAKKDPRRHESGLVKTFNALLDILSRSDISGTKEALAAIQEAVVFFRSLAAKDPRRYEPDLAKTLNMLPDPLSKEGNIAEALEAQEEAIKILRRLSLSNPARYEYELAENLLTFSDLLFKGNDLGKAHAIAHEAVVILGRLSKDDSARYEKDMKEALALSTRES